METLKVYDIQTIIDIISAQIKKLDKSQEHSILFSVFCEFMKTKFDINI